MESSTASGGWSTGTGQPGRVGRKRGVKRGSQESASQEAGPGNQEAKEGVIYEGGWSPAGVRRPGACGLPMRLGAGSLNSAVP